MASTFTNQKISSSFFILILFLSSQTEARQGKLFFSKYVHLTKNTNKNNVTIPNTIPNKDSSKSSDEAPAPAPFAPTSHISNAPSPMEYEYGYAPAPLGSSYAPAPLESENAYYGLYSKDDTSTNFPSYNEKTTNVDDVEEDGFSSEESSDEVPNELNFKESNTYENTESNNDLSNNNGFWTSNHESYNPNYNGGYTNEPEGMSDTRLLDNGKYYYDMERENYGPKRDEFAAENNVNVGGYGYYGNSKKSKYEFDSMEEYEKQEGYTDFPKDQFMP